jgi:hypothetical protein
VQAPQIRNSGIFWPVSSLHIYCCSTNSSHNPNLPSIWQIFIKTLEMLSKNILKTVATKPGFAIRAFSEEKLLKTAFYDLHLELGGKMVPFAGYNLPVQYEGLGVLKEHLHTRQAGQASLFDVSHMGQIRWHGKDRVKFIEKMVVGDIASLAEGEAKLSLIMNEQGTIVDDTVITNAGDHIYMVVNGACKWKDMDHFKKYVSGFDVQMEYLETQQLVALQVSERTLCKHAHRYFFYREKEQRILLQS